MYQKLFYTLLSNHNQQTVIKNIMYLQKNIFKLYEV